MSPELDAVVVGAGPNGLAAAIAVAQTGRRVRIYEAAATVGGGCRSAELTLPGFVHDVCSAVHPFAVASPFFETLPLGDHGLTWLSPPVMIAHPLERGRSAAVWHSLEETARNLGADGDAYRRLVGSFVEAWPRIHGDVMAPLRWPQHPLTMARFGWHSMKSAASLARSTFTTEAARALVAGIAAHGMLPLDQRPTAAFALALNITAHVGGWCVPQGGAQQLANALARYFRSLGGEIETNAPITSIDELPTARATFCDLSPRPLLGIAGHRFPAWYRRALERYRYGMGTYKVDWALDGPIPWRNEECARAGTVHIGGTLEEIAASERDAWEGRHAARPYVLLSQPSIIDSTRAPRGKHVAWTYCHTPHASPIEMLPRIEQQIERFAPGFRHRVLARSVMRPLDYEQYNPNFVGGDIGSGVVDVSQLFARPTWRTYSTPVRGLYICSAATPPGVGVHGMCGYHAAQRALREVLRD